MSTATLNSEKKKALIPKLRFQEFSKVSLYKKYSFNDVFQFSTGKNIKQNEASPDFETPCVRYGELYHMYNEVIYNVINKTSLDKSELHFSKGDEILLPSAGEDPLDIGSASALTIENIAIGRTINILRPIKENVYSQIYASYYINHKLKKKISKLAKGSSISNVYNSDLKTLEIILPDFSEQQKIASFLSAVDEKIQQLSRKKELLGQYKKGVMQQLFSGILRFKDANGMDYADWEEKVLGDILKRTSTGLNPRTNFILGSGKNYYVTIKNISNGTLDFKSCEKIDDEAMKLIKKRSDLSKNDIIMSSIGNIGEAYLLDKDPIDWNINESVFVLRASEYVLPKYLYYIITNDISKCYFESNSTGSSFKSIKLVALKLLPIKLPSLHEQQKIANFLSSIDAKIEITSQQMNQMQSFKKGLLQQLFVKL